MARDIFADIDIEIIEVTEPERLKNNYYRTAYCKACGEYLDSRADEICDKCGWIICPACGDCGCC